MRCRWRQNQFQARLLILETLTYSGLVRLGLMSKETKPQTLHEKKAEFFLLLPANK